jgi:hypothetical protein
MYIAFQSTELITPVIFFYFASQLRFLSLIKADDLFSVVKKERSVEHAAFISRLHYNSDGASSRGLVKIGPECVKPHDPSRRLLRTMVLFRPHSSSTVAVKLHHCTDQHI